MEKRRVQVEKTITKSIFKYKQTWFEVSVVQTESPSLLPLQHWKHLFVDPGFIVNVVGDKSIVVVRRALPSPPLIVDKGQKEVVGVGQMPPQEMVNEGCEECKQNQTSAEYEAEEASVYPTGASVKVQELVPLLAHRKGTSILVAINYLRLVVALHPLFEANVGAFAR